MITITKRVPYWERKSLWCRFDIHNMAVVKVKRFFSQQPISRFAGDSVATVATDRKCTRCGQEDREIEVIA